jgi:hypothetical protein
MTNCTSISRRNFSRLLLASGVGAVLPSGSQTMFPKSGARDQRTGAQDVFAHPGMLQSAGDLRRMREGVRSRKQPLYSGFEKLRDDPHSQLSYQPAGASEEIGRNPNVRFGMFDSDCNAAHQCALMGHISGDLAYFHLCARMVDDWATTLKRITGADAVLCAGLGGFKIANAAELLRWSPAGWPAENAERFGRMLREVVLPVLSNFAPFANGNWDTAALKTMMAIAIYTDDRDLFERALVYYNHGCGDGNIANYIYSNGQCQESGRDQQHTQLGIAHMGDCCEMAWHQGLDLYGVLDNRLLLGFEYTARYILGEDVPFTPDEDRTGKYKHSVIAPRSALRNNFEQVFNHYTKRRGLPAPWTARAAEKVRPEGPGFQADATGFGTILYTRDPGSDTSEAAAVARVAGLYITSIPGAEVQWIPLAVAASYSLIRTDPSAKSGLRVPVKLGRNDFVDRTARLGSPYSYRITASNARSSSLASPAVAGLPQGWATANLGAEPLQGSAFFDGATWRISAAGGSTDSAADGSAFFVHTIVSGKRFVTARLSPLFASQALHAGIGLFRELKIDAPSATLLLEPNAMLTTEHVGWVLRHYARDAYGVATVAGEERLVEPAVRYGRVQVPLWLRLEEHSGMTLASYSMDGSNWTTIGAGPSLEGSCSGGVLLNSGLGAITAEIFFDHVAVAGARSSTAPSQSH